ncbi:MAG: thioredoxin fold domain-containing protein [Chitinophagaceae bacterium]|nr:thioredoxin fold domain-containing protein [Chitinophagaceae bacterium]
MKKAFTYILFFLVVCTTNACAQSGKNFQRVASGVFKKALDSIADKQVIDVRTSGEFKEGYIPGAKNINIYDADFLEQISGLDKNIPILVYCKGGARSADAARQMQKMGFKNIYELEGGIMSWEHNNFPVEKPVENNTADLFTIAHFDSLLARHNTLMIDFYAPWCMPCREMEPSLKKLAKQYQGKMTIHRINVDQAKQLAKALNIEGIPVIATYKNGTQINRVTGFQSAANLRNLANEAVRKK